MQELAKLMDDEEIVRNMVGRVSQKAGDRYGLALNTNVKQQLDQVVSSSAPALKQTVHNEVLNEIKALGGDGEPKPLAVLLMPMVLLASAAAPLAVFHCPTVLLKSAAAPVAVLLSAVLSTSVPAPTPVLKAPVVSLKSENQPTAVLPAPVVRFLRAFCPSAVVKLGYPPSGGGTTARAFGQITTIATTNRARMDRIGVFIDTALQRNSSIVEIESR